VLEREGARHHGSLDTDLDVVVADAAPDAHDGSCRLRPGHGGNHGLAHGWIGLVGQTGEDLADPGPAGARQRLDQRSAQLAVSGSIESCEQLGTGCRMVVHLLGADPQKAGTGPPWHEGIGLRSYGLSREPRQRHDRWPLVLATGNGHSQHEDDHVGPSIDRSHRPPPSRCCPSIHQSTVGLRVTLVPQCTSPIMV